MSTIEDRVVSMKFQGDQFLNGINASIQKLDQFNGKIKSMGTAGLDNVAASAEKLGSGGLHALGEGVQHIADRFKTMGIVATTAIANVTSQAVGAGERMIKSLTIDPIMAGFNEYELKMGSIQTILSNTARYGTKLPAVNSALEELNHYADKTIYNFGDMTKNVGLFTNAGLRVEEATSIIKGFSNEAAASGTSAEGAAGAAYQLSQALSAGKVTLMDWRSLQNVGMGNKNMQSGIIEIAKAMGTFNGKTTTAKAAQKDFNGSLEKGWLSSKVMSNYLKIMAGDMSVAKMKALGLSDAQIKVFQAQQKMSEDSATKVRTFTGLIGTLREAVGSGWSETFGHIFGDFNEATKLFTGISDTLGGMVQKSSDARNKVISEWASAKMGGRAALFEGLANSFKALMSVLKPIKDAFREMFPAKTAQDLTRMSLIFRNFTRGLEVSGSTANKIKRAFAGVFAIFGIGWDILKQVIGLIARLTGVAFEGGGGFLDFAAKVGDFLVNLRQAIKDGKGLENIFKGIGDWLEIPIRAIKLFGQALSKAFDKVGGDKVIEAVDKISAKTEPMAHQAEKIATGWEKVKAPLLVIWDKISAIGSWIISKFAGLGKVVGEFFSGFNFDDITKGINTGLFAGLVIMFKQWLGGGGKGGFMDNINNAINGLTGTLKAMQQTLKATALLEIALAIAALTLSMHFLSKIDAGGLVAASSAMTVMFGQLVGASILLDKMTTLKGAAKLPLIAGSLILMSGAILILSIAVKQLAGLSWEEIAKGLLGITAIMAMMIEFIHLLPDNAQFILAAASLLLLSFSIRNMASAVATLGGLSWNDMIKGLLGLGAVMGAILLFINNAKVDAKGGIKGAVILGMALAISKLAGAVKEMAGMSWEEMVRGLAVTAAGLYLITDALNLIPKDALVKAGSILVAAVALKLISSVVAQNAGLSLEDAAKGLGVMAASLGILAVALTKMGKKEILEGAGALAIAAGSLQLLSVSLAANAGLSWEQIGKGMAVMAGSLLLLTVAMKAMQENMMGSQALITAAGALALIGGVMEKLGGLSWTQVAVGLVALAGVFIILGLAALILEPVIPALYSLAIAVALIGVAMLAAGAGIALFGLGVLLLALGFGALAVSGVAGATALIGMMSVLIGGLPVIVELVSKLLLALIQVVIDAVPKLQEMGVAIMTGFINGIRKVVPLIIEVVLYLLLTLVTKLRQYVPRIADEGLKMLTALLKVWAANIGKVVDAAADLIVAFLKGLARNIPRVAKEATNVITTFIKEIGKSANKIADAGMDMIVDFVNGLADSVRDHSEDMRSAGKNLAMAIIDGMTGGLGTGASKIMDKAKEVARGALDAAKHVLGINSPSKEFAKIGNGVNEGFRNGLDGNAKQVATAAGLVAQSALDSATGVLGINSPSKEFEKIGNYVNDGFRKGLDGNKNQIDRSFNDLKSKLLTLSRSAKATAAERKKAATAYSTLTKSMTDEHAMLGQLANRYDTVTAKLKKANEEYAKAVKSRKEFDEYEKSTRDKYSDVSTPANDQSATDFVESLKKQVEDTKTFTNQMHQLAKMGLNQETFKDLMDQGLDALPFVTDLLKGGQGQIDQINDLNKEIDNLGDSLGKGAADDLYQIGVNSAAGLVAGLKKEQAAIEAQMDKIASTMVGSIKKALGIHSPSRVFAQVGKYSAQGLKMGLEKHSDVVADSASSMGNKAVEAMRASLSNMDKMVAGNIDVQPRIRPVLDLTDIRKNATKLTNLVPANQKMSVKTSFASAASLAAEVNDRHADDGTDPATGGVQLNYTQINNSPKALSPVEIYRGTKNQLSTVKGALST